MQYQGLQPGMVGDQIAKFKRADGSTFFANTGAAQMQTGGAGIQQPGPDLEGMRSMRSGPGETKPPISQLIGQQMIPSHVRTAQPVGGFWDAAGRGSVAALDAIGEGISSARENFNPSNLSVSNTLQDLAGIPRGMPPGNTTIPSTLKNAFTYVDDIKNRRTTKPDPLLSVHDMGGADLPLSAQGIPPQFGEQRTGPQADKTEWLQDYNDLSGRNMPKKRMVFPWNTTASVPGQDEMAVRNKRKKDRENRFYGQIR